MEALQGVQRGDTETGDEEMSDAKKVWNALDGRGEPPSEDDEGFEDYLMSEADRVLADSDSDDLELSDATETKHVSKRVRTERVPLVVRAYEKLGNVLSCVKCGKEILNRPTFREKQKCIPCRLEDE